MVQWLFFDRINTKAAAAAVGREHHPITDALPNEAETALPVIQFAEARAKPALDSPVWQSLPPAATIIRLC
jgi:hypothetical protein